MRSTFFVAITVVVLMVFWRSRLFDFVVFDDDYNIFRNEHLGVVTWRRAQWMFMDADYTRRYMPLGWLAFSSVVSLNGFSPKGFHLANILFHAINTGMYFLLLSSAVRLLKGQDSIYARVLIPAAIALWWGGSPLRVEVVGWASSLLYNTATFFLLVALLAYSSGYLCPIPARRSFFFWAAGIAFVASLLVYPIMIGGAACVVALEACLSFKQNKSVRGTVGDLLAIARGRLLVWIIAACGAAVVASVSAAHSGEFWQAKVSATIADRVLETPYFFIYYLVIPWCPTRLSPVYDVLVPPVALQPVFVIATVVGVLLVGLIAWLVWRDHPQALFAAIAFIGMLLPVSPLFHDLTATSDRYAQGVTLLIGFVAMGWSTTKATKWKQVSLIVIFVTATSVYLPVTSRQLQVWSNTETLMQQVLLCCQRPGPVRVAALVRILDFYHYYRGDSRAAEDLLNRESILSDVDKVALRTRPVPPLVRGRFVPAPTLVLYRAATTIDIPNGDFRTAAARLDESLRWAPNFWESHVNIATVDLILKRTDDAKAHFDRAVAIPGSAIDKATQSEFWTWWERAKAAEGQAANH